MCVSDKYRDQHKSKKEFQDLKAVNIPIGHLQRSGNTQFDPGKTIF